MEKIILSTAGELKCQAEAIRRGESIIVPANKSCLLSLGRACQQGVDASDLATLIGALSPSLEAIKLKGATVVDNPVLVLDALSRCHRLKSFHSSNFQFRLPESQTSIGRALAQLPCLEEIKIRGTFLNLEILPIFQRPSNVLRKVTVGEIYNDELCQLFEACATCANLQELAVERTLSRGNLSPTRGSPPEPPTGEAVAQLVRQTTSLKKLKVVTDSSEIDMSSLAEALNVNHSLKGLHLERRDLDRHTTAIHSQVLLREIADLFDVLQHHNFTLEEIIVWPLLYKPCGFDESASKWEIAGISSYCWIRGASIEAQAHLAGIHFYLSLNKTGRDKLVGRGNGTATTEDWWKAIINQQDPSVIYHFLRANPSLCQQAHCIQDGNQKETRQMRRSLAAWLSLDSGKTRAQNGSRKRKRNPNLAESAPSSPCKMLCLESNRIDGCSKKSMQQMKQSLADWLSLGSIPGKSLQETSVSSVGNTRAVQMVTTTLKAMKQNPEALSPAQRAQVVAELRSTLAALEKSP